jgi:hypothetical protein
MKLSDFSSLVQLGVGIHFGTALFQIIAEFASSPLERKLNRLRELATARDLSDAGEDALDALGDLEIKSVQFFNDYRNAIAGNGIVALLLVMILIWISVDADEPVSTLLALVIIALSVFPAFLSLGFLWFRWLSHTERLRNKAKTLERVVIYGNRS